MEKPENATLKANSSAPDIAFYQLKMNGNERVIGFIDNDSEEQFGRLARRGGEILLPGVFPQKEEAGGNHREPGSQEKALKIRIPNSDTEIENLLFFGKSSANDLGFLKEGTGVGRETGIAGSSADKDPTAQILTLPLERSRTSRFSNDSRFSRSEDCECCKPVADDISVYADGSESVLQTQHFTEDKESAMEEFGDDTGNAHK